MSKSEAYSQATWSYGMPMYWHEKQVVVAFQSEVLYSTTLKKGADAAIKSLNLDWLGSFLAVRGLQLKPFTQEQVARPVSGHRHEHNRDRDEDAKDSDAKREKVEGGAYVKNGHHGEQSGEYDATRELNNPIGKFLFPSPLGNRTTVIGFFNVDAFDTGYPLQDESESGYGTSSVTRRAVNLLNSNLAMIRDEGKVPVMAAGPNWLGGGSGLGCTTTGGPADPPCPVFDTNACSSSNGFWPITVPMVENSQLAHYTGEGVTVFVLDTMPGIVNPTGVQTPSHVLSANGEATTHNGLLETVTGQMNAASPPYIKIHYQDLPPMNDGDFLLGTGRDINGKPYGYLMPDHGLFVTGIVRDVAPGAIIEFVRVLDDYGVGSTDTVISALGAIQTRIGPLGDLHGKPVVVNLSLLVSPPDDLLPSLWFGNNATFNANQVYRANYDLALLNAPLHDVIKSLTGTGAVVVAAAGNESNTSDIPRRIGPAYPAAYPEVIAVGAVDSQGAAAAYSNYPQSLTQPYGIATYGGALLPSDALTNHQDIDAVRGLYSSESYPQLDSQNTGSVPQPPQPNSHWAYWSGTSFAAPIISAVAARVLQLKAGSIPANLWTHEMQYLLTTALGQQELFGHALAPQPDLGVSLLVASQGCLPTAAQPVAATPHQAASRVG